MINTVLIEKDIGQLQTLANKIERFCPCLNIQGTASLPTKIPSFLIANKPNLIFANPEISVSDLRQQNDEALANTEIILVFNTNTNFSNIIHHQIAGYIFSPIQDDILIHVVERVRKVILEKIESKKNQLILEKLLKKPKVHELVGIPTIEGYEFVNTQEIIRCEGLRTYTLVITTDKTDIVSSYNIGQFTKLLTPYGFFSPHKSHLINLKYIKKYKREGTILLKDHSYVPVAKRRKSEFLKQMVHL